MKNNKKLFDDFYEIELPKVIDSRDKIETCLMEIIATLRRHRNKGRANVRAFTNDTEMADIVNAMAKFLTSLIAYAKNDDFKNIEMRKNEMLNAIISGVNRMKYKRNLENYTK